MIIRLLHLFYKVRCAAFLIFIWSNGSGATGFFKGFKRSGAADLQK